MALYLNVESLKSPPPVVAVVILQSLHLFSLPQDIWFCVPLVRFVQLLLLSRKGQNIHRIDQSR